MYTHMYPKLCTALIALALVIGVAGCTDTVVEPESSVTGTNVFNDPGAYESFAAKLYAGLTVTGQEGPAGNGDIQGIDEGFSQYIRLIWQMQQLPTDEAIIAWNDAGVQELNTQTWSSSNQFLSAMYYRVFFQVSQVGEFLRETTDDKLAERGVSDNLRATIQQYRAEARFLRALSYWHGIDLFGDIPLVTEESGIGSTPPEQATRAEVFNYIVEELNAIRGDLPAAGQAEYGRADQGAVAMLLAKLYLNAEVYVDEPRYADVISALDPVLNGGGYMLDDNYQDIFLADNHTSPEIIFPVPQDGENTQSFGGTTFLCHAAVGGSMSAADFGLDFGWAGLRTTPEAVGLFPGGATGPDVRNQYFFTEGQTVDIPSITTFTNGIAAPKYQNVTSTGQPGSDLTFPDTDYPMFRLADAYLMYAEAVLRGGGGSRAQAVDYINELRARAYGDESGAITDADLTLAFILDERARELFWEGHRRTDLIRYNQYTENGTWAWKGGEQAGRTTDGFRDLYPLPASELIANPNLEQNEGY